MGDYLAGPVPDPPVVTLGVVTVTTVTLSWEQPAGDAVDNYIIVYTYQGGCSAYTQPENMATAIDGTAREYTLQNLQEFSGYVITVTAVNTGGGSMSDMITATTMANGMHVVVVSIRKHIPMTFCLSVYVSSQWSSSVSDDIISHLQQHHCPVGSC